VLGTRDLPGRSARELALGSGGSSFQDLLDAAYHSGQRTEVLGLAIVPRDAAGEPVGQLHFDFAVVPIVDVIGEVTGIFIMGFDVTDRVCAQRNLRETMERQAFLLELSDTLRNLSDPLEVQYAAARAIGERLGVSRCFYCDVEQSERDEWFVVHRDYHVPGIPSTAGRFQASRFGALAQELLSGRSLAVCNVAEEYQLTAVERSAYLNIGAQAWCAVPLMKNGRVVALLGVGGKSARRGCPRQGASRAPADARGRAAASRARPHHLHPREVLRPCRRERASKSLKHDSLRVCCSQGSAAGPDLHQRAPGMVFAPAPAWNIAAVIAGPLM
jgi:hypothetical protein